MTVGSIETGIALALLAALMANLASLLKHRGCQHVAPVQIQRPLDSVRGLAASPWFAAGWALAAVAWLVHVAALSMAPISLVQALLAGGAVTLAVMAQRIFGEPVERRQWLALLLGSAGLALLLGSAGLALLVVTVPHFGSSHSDFAVAAILGFEGGLALLAAGLALGHRAERFAARRGVLCGALAGTLFALAGIAIKGLIGAAGASAVIVVPWIALIVLCGALAQWAAVAALQRGGAIETIGLMGLVANATQIAGGLFVFGDPLATSPLGISLQATAFAMVCLSALLLPRREAIAQTPRAKLSASIAAAPAARPALGPNRSATA